MFYQFNQNNSGGFYLDDYPSIVLIEADNAEEANALAQDFGLYFNGCASGRDCSCCGDRWSPAYGKGDSVPSIYKKPVNDRFPQVDGRLTRGQHHTTLFEGMPFQYKYVIVRKDATIHAAEQI